MRFINCICNPVINLTLPEMVAEHALKVSMQLLTYIRDLNKLFNVYIKSIPDNLMIELFQVFLYSRMIFVFIRHYSEPLHGSEASLSFELYPDVF